MLRTGRGIAAVCLRGTKFKFQRTLKTENPCLTLAAKATTSQKLQAEEEAVDTGLGSTLAKAKDVPTLIQSGIHGNSPFVANKAIEILSDWVDVQKVDFKNDIETDENFTKLLSIIADLKNPALLLIALKNLHKLGVSDNAYVMQGVQNNLLWNVRRVSIPVLMSIMLFHKQHQKTDMQKKVLKETIETIQRRWVEIRGAKEIQLLFPQHELFSLDFLGHLDDHTIELAKDMKYAELCGIFCALGTSKRRATPVLRALAFHMAKQDDKLSPKQLSNILYAMHVLSFPDQVLLEKISKDLIPQVTEINRPTVVGAILFCMGQMRWRHIGLLEVLSEWIEKNIQLCRVNDLVTMVLTLASISYTPTNAENLFNLVIPNLHSSAINTETIWVDVVWSLSLLGKATNDHISSVLNPSFVSKTTCVAQHLSMGIKLKLLNINAVAQLLMPSYDGPYLDLSEFKDIIITQSRREVMLTKHVQKMLHNFLPPPRYIRKNIQTSFGIFVDNELAVDVKGKPIPIQDYSDNFGESKSPIPLPDGASKIAMFVWDYKDYTIGSQELTGVNKFAVELMNEIGYKVVQVPFFEYNVKAKTINNIQYLENKIKEVTVES